MSKGPEMQKTTSPVHPKQTKFLLQRSDHLAAVASTRRPTVVSVDLPCRFSLRELHLPPLKELYWTFVGVRVISEEYQVIAGATSTC